MEACLYCGKERPKGRWKFCSQKCCFRDWKDKHKAHYNAMLRPIMRERMRETYAERGARGVCKRCGGKVDGKWRSCSSCRGKTNAYYFYQKKVCSKCFSKTKVFSLYIKRFDQSVKYQVCSNKKCRHLDYPHKLKAEIQEIIIKEAKL